MGKEDPFELNSSQTLLNGADGIVIGGSRNAFMKYLHDCSCLTNASCGISGFHLLHVLTGPHVLLNGKALYADLRRFLPE